MPLSSKNLQNSSDDAIQSSTPNTSTQIRENFSKALLQILERGILPAEYKNDTNIQKYLAQIEKIFTQKPQNLEALGSIIYDLLTCRPEANQFATLFQEKKVTEQSRWYQDSLAETAKVILKQGMEVRDHNPQWFQINTIPNTNQNGVSYKVYQTFRFEDYGFVRFLPLLALDLKLLAEKSKDPISFKINNSLGGFAKYNDSLVIHCSREESVKRVNEILKHWKIKNNIISTPRYLDRSEVAIDGKHETGGKKLSFSELVSHQTIDYARVLADRQIHPYKAAEAVIATAIMYSQKTPHVSQ